MGYYTNFSLSAFPTDFISQRDPSTFEKEVLSVMSKVNPGYFSEEDNCFNDVFSDTMKWYDHEKDMREVSKYFPDMVFELEGVGEDFDDIWIKYFCNGKMQSCYGEITYPPFDKSKMK